VLARSDRDDGIEKLARAAPKGPKDYFRRRLDRELKPLGIAALAFVLEETPSQARRARRLHVHGFISVENFDAKHKRQILDACHKAGGKVPKNENSSQVHTNDAPDFRWPSYCLKDFIGYNGGVGRYIRREALKAGNAMPVSGVASAEYDWLDDPVYISNDLKRATKALLDVVRNQLRLDNDSKAIYTKITESVSGYSSLINTIIADDTTINTHASGEI